MSRFRLEDLLGAPFFYHAAIPGNITDASSVTLISDTFDVADPFEGMKKESRNIQAVRLLCDEFTVSLHLNRLRSGFGTPPTFTSAQVNLEAVTQATTNGGLTYAITNSPDDLTLTLTQSNGYNQTFIPGPRAFRFRAPIVVNAGPITPNTDSIIMEVTGRLRNHAALLMAMDRLLRGHGQYPGIISEKLPSGATVRRFDTRELCGV